MRFLAKELFLLLEYDAIDMFDILEKYGIKTKKLSLKG